MAFKVQTIIWDLFGERANINDKFKNSAGKGLQQRFVELLAKDFDDNEGGLINLMVDHTRDPFTQLQRFIPYHEGIRGVPLISTSIPVRRKLNNFHRRLIQRKGTKSGYEMLLKIIGFATVTINEIVNVSGFDSAVLFDDPVRLFDQRCKSCSDYDVVLKLPWNTLSRNNLN